MAKLVRLLHMRDDVEHSPRPKLPPDASVGKRWRFRRNTVILVAHLNGISQRTLAEVFDLPRSRVALIIKELSGPDFIPPARVQELADRLPLPSMPMNISVGKRLKFRRNTVIYIAYSNGFSQRTLADVFDLPRSRVSSILEEFR